MEHKSDRQFSFDRVFNEKDQYMGYIFGAYNKIYDLKKIDYEGVVTKGLFNYVIKRKYFVLLVIYDGDGNVYMERNLQDDLFWSLPGGSIRKNEEIHSTIRRLSDNIPSKPEKMVLGEIEPVAFITNKFKYGNQTCSHYGIAFIARLRNKSNIGIDESTGSFVNPTPEEIKKINRFANKEVVKLSVERINNYDTPPPEEEVSTNEDNQFRYLLHNQIVKRFVLTDKLKHKKEFINRLKSFVGSSKSLLDVSCGDSNLIQRISPNGCDFIIANDISWSQINLINVNNPKTIFTNHNAQFLPFKPNSFDLAYCGNTLHHMRSKRELLNLFHGLAGVAKKILIVEIENPRETGWLPYVLNKYWYGYFLRDVGGSYFSKEDFRTIINDYFSGSFGINFDEFKNIQGNYLIAEVTKNECAELPANNKVLEIEQKFICKNIDSLIDKCLSTGYIKTEQSNEVDEYFTDLDGKFVKDRTCLRIRSNDLRCELTFKGKSSDSTNAYSKEENNIYLNPELKRNMLEMLTSLKYCKYVTVKKRRVIYSKKGDGFGINISIDSLESVGDFVEFELAADSKHLSQRVKLEKKLSGIVKEFQNFGLKPANLPYRDYTAKHFAKEVYKNQKIKAIFFDFDGTIVPTEEIFFQAYKKIVKDYFDKEISKEEYRLNELENNDKLFDLLTKPKASPKINKKIFMDRVYKEYSKNLVKIAENEEVGLNLKMIFKLKNRGYKLALVSTSKKDFIKKVLGQFKALKLFDVIISREDVVRLKPHPEAYSLALKKMKLKPNLCLVIEDSKRGLVSAQKAKLNCVVVNDGSFSSATPLFDSKILSFESLSEICLPLLYA